MKTSIQKIIAKMTSKNLNTGLLVWSDEECLENFSKFLDRVELGTGFIPDIEGNLTHQVLTAECGDKVVSSDPVALTWPLQYIPRPDDGLPTNKGQFN